MPVSWDVEFGNVIAKCESSDRGQVFLASIDAAPIVPDPSTHTKALHATLDLALRTMLPLAALAANLRLTVRRAGVERFDPALPALRIRHLQRRPPLISMAICVHCQPSLIPLASTSLRSVGFPS